jgi:hypothetical protein
LRRCMRSLRDLILRGKGDAVISTFNQICRHLFLQNSLACRIMNDHSLECSLNGKSKWHSGSDIQFSRKFLNPRIKCASDVQEPAVSESAVAQSFASPAQGRERQPLLIECATQFLRVLRLRRVKTGHSFEITCGRLIPIESMIARHRRRDRHTA